MPVAVVNCHGKREGGVGREKDDRNGESQGNQGVEGRGGE